MCSCEALGCSAPAAVNAVPSSQHLLFVPTIAGYVLVEGAGAAPPCHHKIELAEPAGSFVVVKLARSPLPNDERLCAYLDRIQ